MQRTSTHLKKNIALSNRLIFALDVSSNAEAKALVEELGDTVSFYKLGLQFFMSGQYREMIDWLLAKDKQVFADLKFYDIPQTVHLAVKALSDSGATFVTVHGNDAILQAAVAAKGSMNVLAVTALTSLDESSLQELGAGTSLKDIVLSRTQTAIAAGCYGVIASGLEAADLRAAYGNDFAIITPGIRPVNQKDDQKRSVSVEQAFNNGADYIVVGRPIRDHHGHPSRKAAAEAIQQTISSLFS